MQNNNQYDAGEYSQQADSFNDGHEQQIRWQEKHGLYLSQTKFIERLQKYLTGSSVTQYQSSSLPNTRQQLDFEIYGDVRQITMLQLGHDAHRVIQNPTLIQSGCTFEDKAASLPQVENLFSYFGSILGQYLNCVAEQSIIRLHNIHSVRNLKWTPTQYADEFLVNLMDEELGLHQSLDQLDQVSNQTQISQQQQNQMLNNYNIEEDLESLPYSVQQCMFTSTGLGSATSASEAAMRINSVRDFLSNPFQRFGWDQHLVDFRLLETIENDEFIHFVCYGAWRVPKKCHSVSISHQVRDAAYCLTKWKIRGRKDKGLALQSILGINNDHNFFLQDTEFFSTFSISRPDVPPVAGRIRMEIDCDDILITPSGITHIRRIDPGGHWQKWTDRCTWYTHNEPESRFLCHNIRNVIFGCP